MSSNSPKPLRYRKRSAIINAAGFVVMLLVLARCSGPAEVQQPAVSVEVAPEPEGPAYAVFYFDEAGLQAHQARSDITRMLLPNSAFLNHRSVSPDGRQLAVAYAGGDSSHLALLDLHEGALRAVHAAPGEVVYTTAWAPEGGALAFGYYEDQGSDQRGPGGIMVVEGEGMSPRSVGCSVSQTVESWLPNGDLVVGDDARLYVVAADDCKTLTTIDARTMFQVTFSPDGQWMAYILRERVYNRPARRYDREFSLYLADARGQDAQKVLGHKYDVQHMTWSPDGTQLAFDVQSQDDPALRHVSIYDVTTGETAFLVNPDDDGRTSETHPVWSPDGAGIAFDRVIPESGVYQKVVRLFVEQHLRVIATAEAKEALGDTWGWAGDQGLLLSRPGGSVALLGLDGASSYTLPAHAALLYVAVR